MRADLTLLASQLTGPRNGAGWNCSGGMRVFPSWGRPSVGQPRMRTVVLSQGLGCICVWKRRCELELFLEAVISLWDFFLAHPISTNFMICLSWHWLSIECSLEPSEKFPLKNCLDQPDLWLCLWRVVLLITWCKRAQPTMDSTSPKAEGFGYLRKLAKHEQGVSQRASSQAAFLHRICLGSLLKFLPWLPLMIDLDLEV